jgi:hypothetical protein
MNMVIRFTIASCVTAVVIIGISFLWPRFTSQNRPTLLQNVHSQLLKTQLGKETAGILGVSDEAHIRPIDLGQAASSAANSIVQVVEKRIETIIAENAVREVRSQLDRLSSDQKEQLQQILCKPPSQ